MLTLFWTHAFASSILEGELAMLSQIVPAVEGVYPNPKHSLTRKEVDERDEIVLLGVVCTVLKNRLRQGFLLKKVAVGAKLIKTWRFK